jgi:hypothetical protein
VLLATTARGGSFRYDLPELLGEYRLDGSSGNGYFNIDRAVDIHAPISRYAVETARIVIEGYGTPGRGHGDGVLREALEFDVIPSVTGVPTAPRATVYGVLSPPALGAFRLEYEFSGPFIPRPGHMPGEPPLGPYGVLATVDINDFHTDYPSIIGPVPEQGIDIRDGIVFDSLPVVNITSAYILLEGPSIVPEPTGGALLATGLSLLFFTRRRLARQRRCRA